MRALFDALRSLVYMTASVSFWGWIALGLRRYDHRLGIVLPAGTGSVGILFMVVGGAIALVCAGAFVLRGRGTPAPFDAPRQFVAVGLYKYVRNPMYIGGWFVLAGFGLYLQSFSILLMSLAILLLAHLFVVFYEEPTLRERFGSVYDAYCGSVSRWKPH